MSSVLTEKEIIRIMREEYATKLEKVERPESPELEALRKELSVYMKQQKKNGIKQKTPALVPGLILKNKSADEALYPVVGVEYKVHGVNSTSTTLISPEGKKLVIKNEKITSDFVID